MTKHATHGKTFRSKRSQRGEAELLTFAIVVGITIALSGTLWILGWVNQNKYSEKRARQQQMLAAREVKVFRARPDPDEYWAHCEKSIWRLLSKNYTCEVTAESYGELLFIEP